jgi:F0F1-type ATP synthase assembly protein I
MCPSPADEPAEQPSREPTAEERAEAAREVNRREADAAWRSIAYLISGPLVYGTAGWLLDHWLGTAFLVGVGIVGGMALSLYLIWFRYGSR